ncbi:MAG: bifunctional DNA-formamidopyrimidine glycosylase/DNA-(apurinic or apyrimidinic site) lyase [Desulfuromonadales bacterium]|nr:bifunctional DNA-formamidopyrimidine glycosylase/DNA-(apurinic or apyrimidinic site) lyase [Desulfuromonadales bacterium]
MPELPEVETTRRGLEPLICNRRITGVVLRVPKLRWPLDPRLPELLVGQQILAVCRRAKYLMIQLEQGCLLLHLGMSGSLRVVPFQTPAGKHDHVDIHFADGQCLRFNDPRRFGLLSFFLGAPGDHPLLTHLGPEPLATDFRGTFLFQRSRNRRLAVKPFIMDQRTVVGVGNIYASEALFRAGIRPDREAGRISAKRYEELSRQIKEVLLAALEAGGTTVADFRQADGRPGYFKQQLQVYGRDGQPCPGCGRSIVKTSLGQRSTFFCRHCQR